MMAAASSSGRLRSSLPLGGEDAEIRRSSTSWDGLQRGRLLSATFALVAEGGYQGVNARRVSERAVVSSRTFYESFSDRGLLENTGGGYPAAGNAWRLTSRGDELMHANRPLNSTAKEIR